MNTIRNQFYYPIVMPIDKDGRGPADLGDITLTWEVWDQLLQSHGSYEFLADAIDKANELNQQNPYISEQIRGLIAFKLTERLVIDIPTARMIVDQAIKEAINDK